MSTENGDNHLKSSKESSDYLQAVINSLNDELLVIDKDYRIIHANEALLTRHGKRKQEVIGVHCYNISHGSPELCHPPHHDCPITSVWETGNSAHVTHLHVYEVDNEERQRYVDIIASPIKDSKGNVIAVTELMRDVTEAKELDLKIAEAHKNLLALNTITNVVSRSLDLDAILANALEKTLEIMDVKIGGILLWDEEKQMLCYQVHRGLSEVQDQALCCNLGESIAGKVAQTGEAILVENISKDPRAAELGPIAIEGLGTFVSVPLRSKNRVLGVLNIASQGASKFSSEDLRLLNNIAAQIAIAVENAKLHQEVQHQDKIRGELLREILSIQEEERKRIARELHDETSQALASIAARLEAVSSMLSADTDTTRARLKELQALSIDTLDGIHNLIYELRPTLLDDLGLVAATRWLVDNNLRPAGVKVRSKAIGKERRLAPQLETTLFRVIQEAISNIVRHAQAKNALVYLYYNKNTIRVHVKDNGIGFDVEEAMTSKDRPRGLGLLGMKERVELMNGTMRICSCPGSMGTEINIEIPMNGDF